MREKPKEFQAFFEILAGALKNREVEETSHLEWNSVVQPLLLLHLKSRINVPSVVEKPVPLWRQSVI